MKPDGSARRTRLRRDAAHSHTACTLSSVVAAKGSNCSPSGVSVRPSGPRRNSGAPSARSSADKRRPMVVCCTPAARAAPAKVLARAASRKQRRSSQFKPLMSATPSLYAQRCAAVHRCTALCGDGESTATP
jgi:hypothetical protein